MFTLKKAHNLTLRCSLKEELQFENDFINNICKSVKKSPRDRFDVISVNLTLSSRLSWSTSSSEGRTMGVLLIGVLVQIRSKEERREDEFRFGGKGLSSLPSLWPHPPPRRIVAHGCVSWLRYSRNLVGESSTYLAKYNY